MGVCGCSVTVASGTQTSGTPTSMAAHMRANGRRSRWDTSNLLAPSFPPPTSYLLLPTSCLLRTSQVQFPTSYPPPPTTLPVMTSFVAL